MNEHEIFILLQQIKKNRDENCKIRVSQKESMTEENRDVNKNEQLLLLLCGGLSVKYCFFFVFVNILVVLWSTCMCVVVVLIPIFEALKDYLNQK